MKGRGMQSFEHILLLKEHCNGLTLRLVGRQIGAEQCSHIGDVLDWIVVRYINKEKNPRVLGVLQYLLSLLCFRYQEMQPSCILVHSFFAKKRAEFPLDRRCCFFSNKIETLT